MRSPRVGFVAAWLAGALLVGTGAGEAGVGFVVASAAVVGPLGVPLHPADVPCVNERTDETGASEPANDGYVDDHPVDWPTAEPTAVGQQ